MADAQRIKGRLDALKAQRQPHESTWRECFDYSYPERGSGFTGSIYLNAVDLQTRRAQNLDSTAADSLRLLVSSILSGLSPPNSRWFSLDIGQETQEERQWLDQVADVIFENIHASNYDAEAFDALLDMGGAGYLVMFVGEGQQDVGYYFETFPLAESYIASTKGQGGRVDVLYREWEWDVAQVVAKYGIDGVSLKVRALFQADKLREKVRLCLAIEPRDQYDKSSPFAVDMPFASCTIETATGHTLKESGYDEFPCVCPRWTRLPSSAYATGPMSQALPDVKSLTRVIELEFAGAETAIAPPFIAEDDGVLNAKNIKLGPKKIIIANSVDSMKALVTGAQVQFSQLMIARLQASIRKTLLADQLPPADGPAKTAYEYQVRVMMIRQLLGPVFGRLQAEYLQPLIERCFGILMRANKASGFELLGPVPESLRDRDYTVRYLSPLARAQKQEEVGSIAQFEQALILKAQIDPSVFDIYDVEESARYSSEIMGVPSKLIRDKRAAAILRKAHQDAAAETQQQQVQLAALQKQQPATAGA